ncbi:MAG: glycosyltransferase family 39 protein, partial [bacterium]
MNQLRATLQLLGKPRTVLIIFIVGFAIRAGMSLRLGESLLPLADQLVFLDMAENIAEGKGMVISQEIIGIPAYVSDSLRAEMMSRPERIRDMGLNAQWGIIKPDTPTAFFEPFYPFFVGAIRYVFGRTPGILAERTELIPIGPRVTIVRLFQSLFDALVILILYYLGVALFTPATGGIAALIYCFYPHSIIFVANIVTQNTYLFLQAVMVFFFVKTLKNQSWQNYVLLGLSAGLTLLTRISLITFIPFIALCLYLPLRKQLRWERFAVALALLVIMMIPWVVRNYQVFSEVIVLPTKGGRNLWEYNNQIFTEEKRTGKATGVDLLYQNFAKRNYDSLKRQDLIEFPEFTDETEIERDRILNQNVKGFIRANPWIYVQLCGFRFYQLFRVTPRSLAGPIATLASWLSFGWILPASFIGLFLSFRR